MCLLEGKNLDPYMPGICNLCSLFLNTCIGTIGKDGIVLGIECNSIESYCEFCVHYEVCGK